MTARKTDNIYGISQAGPDFETVLGIELAGKEAAKLLGVQLSQLSKLTSAGVLSRAGRKYVLGEVVLDFIRHLKSGTKSGSQSKRDDLESEKLQAQIEAIKLKNEAYVSQLKKDSYEEIRAELVKEVSELKRELRKRPELLAALGSAIDAVTARLGALEPKAITIKAEPVESDEQ